MKVLVVILLLQLSACANLATLQSDIFSLSENNAKVAGIKQWAVIGRVSIKQLNDTWLANVDWQHNECTDELVISASLSGVLANIRYQGKRIIVETREGIQVLNNNEELYTIIGFTPPINYLKYWVRGLIAPNTNLLNDTGFVDDGRSFDQAGWQVRLHRYRQEGDVWLPHSVSIKGKNSSIKLAVEQWLE